MYAYGFRFYFTPLSGVLFAFPSRYWFTIGQSVVFSLGQLARKAWSGVKYIKGLVNSEMYKMDINITSTRFIMTVPHVLT